jgi:hypothetical protein
MQVPVVQFRQSWTRTHFPRQLNFFAGGFAVKTEACAWKRHHFVS